MKNMIFEIIPFWELKLQKKEKEVVLKARQKYKVTLSTFLSLPITSFILLKDGVELYGEPLLAEKEKWRKEQAKELEQLTQKMKSFMDDLNKGFAKQ